MKKPDIPDNEAERLIALYEYHILDSLDEEEYDDITRMASDICMTPISVISIIDSHRQWFKSRVGLEAKETEREISFCGHAINNPKEIMIVSDARTDERFSDNPLVTGNPNIVFYAGVPLVDDNGFTLGTLCAIDNKPKELNEKQIDSLKLLAKKVIALLTLRKKNKELNESKKFLFEAISFSSPYFLLLDKHQNILELGPNFSKSNPELKKGNYFHDFFDWENKFDYKEFLNDQVQINKIIFFKSKNKNQRFKCSVKKYNSFSFFVFATAVINTEYPIQNYQLKLTDFPKQDYIAEYLFLQQSATRGIEDAQKLNQILLQKNKQLETAKKDLLNVNNALEEKVNERTKQIKNLALFPEQNPNPVFELNYELRKINYSNPAAKTQIIKDQPFGYDDCLKLLGISQEIIETKNANKIEFKLEDKFYEINIFFLDNAHCIRMYLHNITEIRNKEISDKLKSESFIHRQQKLIELRNLSDELELEKKLKIILPFAAEELSSDVTGIFKLDSSEKGLHADFLFSREQNDFTEGYSIEKEIVPAYFMAIEERKMIRGIKGAAVPSHLELKEKYLEPRNLKSFFDFPILKSKKLVGVLRFDFKSDLIELVDEDLSFASRISDIIALIYEAENLKISKLELQEKNTELQNSYDKLLSLQTEIVKQEKLATLGMLIAGIAHEINTPLGAIKASNENISDVLKRELGEKLTALDPVIIKTGFELFTLHRINKDVISTREEREIYKVLEKELKVIYPESQNLNYFAKKIYELGYKSIPENFIPFLKHPFSVEAFAFASTLIRIIKSSDTIGIAVEKATRVVKALNNFSHGNITHEVNHFNLKESVDSIVVLLWNKIKKGAKIINEIEEHVELFGNQEELSQVWTNIINNALQASDNKCTVRISHQYVSETHTLIFANNGPAIPENQLPKIFDAFFSTKKRGEGTGLGLNIVKKIIEKHGGSIHCESNADETRFIIQIKNT